MRNDKDRGLYDKFVVSRSDGSSNPDGKHARCVNFVLDCTHDKHAIPALKAYIASCRIGFPKLARDLECVLDEVEPIEQTPLENSSRLATEIARMLFAKLGPVPLVFDEVRLGAILAISFQTHKDYLETVRQRSTPVETPPKSLDLYTHKKSGRLYEKHFDVTDCTNSRDGTKAVVYALAYAGTPAFVREDEEFREKFEPWSPEEPSGA